MSNDEGYSAIVCSGMAGGGMAGMVRPGMPVMPPGAMPQPGQQRTSE